MGCDRNFINVILLGIAFMFVFTAFQTMGNIEQTVLDSISSEDKDFKGDGYTSLSVIYATLALFNWLAPSVISVFGPKIAMVYGGLTYLAFILTFLWPQTWLLYTASFVLGTGAAMIWTGQGNYLTINSTPATISRNSGVFWALLQLSMFQGNLFVYFKFQGLKEVHKDVRTVVMSTLAVVCAIGIVIVLVLPRPKKDEDNTEVEVKEGPVAALKGAAKLFVTKRMLLLSVTFIYTGVELSFFSGVYSSSIGFTKQLGTDTKQLVGLSGIMIGVGEVLGGLIFGILGAKFRKWGRDPIVMAGFIIHMLAFSLIFVNLPNNAPFTDTFDKAIITSSATLAIFCSFLLGFADSCFNTQCISMLGGVYSSNSASAFAIFKFTQSLAAAACFFYSSQIGLRPQLAILVVLAILGTISFVIVEWGVKKESTSEDSSGATARLKP